MTTNPSRLPDISTYIDLVDRFVEREITAPVFVSSFLHMMKSEQRTLSDPIYPLLQELFEDADAYVESLERRTDAADLDDEQLRACALRTRQGLRDIGFE